MLINYKRWLCQVNFIWHLLSHFVCCEVKEITMEPNVPENAANSKTCGTVSLATSTPLLAVCRRVTSPYQALGRFTSHAFAVFESDQGKEGQDTWNNSVPFHLSWDQTLQATTHVFPCPLYCLTPKPHIDLSLGTLPTKSTSLLSLGLRTTFLLNVEISNETWSQLWL